MAPVFRIIKRKVATAALAVGFAVTGGANACDLALVLAVDISGSVDTQEFNIQMQGLANGLRDGVIAEALVNAKAAIILVQWTGSTRQSVSVPWVQVRSFDDIERLADQIEGTERRWRNYSTAIGEALEFSLELLQGAPVCKRRVIDVSGDGVSNEGIEPVDVAPGLRRANVTVNALVIEGDGDDLSAYFWENVIGGEGAFVVTANGFGEYAEKMRLKLRREITKQVSRLQNDDWGRTSEPPLEPEGAGASRREM